MPLTEHTINDALAAALRQTRRAWYSSDVVRSENTGMLKGSAARPDILVVETNVSPVIIETEVLPAVTLEAEALSRLGVKIKGTGRTVVSAVAVRMPAHLRALHPSKLSKGLASESAFEMAVFTGTSPKDFERWPTSGWLVGGVADLSLITQSATVPPAVIDKAVDELISGVSDAAGLLAELTKTHGGALKQISTELRQEDGEQTRRMAATILANAFVFHETLAGGLGKLGAVKTIAELRTKGGLTKASILVEWKRILEINYWPIFDIARRILEHLPTGHTKELIERLAQTADKLLDSRVMRSHDLTGAVFQRMIVDRKYLAAFYTTPASAALLVGLAITPESALGAGSWSSPEDVKALRIADFACGTGTLLSTAYQRVGQLHELSGGDAEAIHPAMMATGIVGCDVLPAAAHLTASMLAGSHPTITYNQSSILTVPYGKQPDGDIRLGSLNILDPQGKLEILAITAVAVGGMGEAEEQTWMALPHRSFDLVLMNPPFTRDTGHEGKKVGVRNPMFAAFSANKKAQEAMAKATKRLTEGTSAHGNAGEASIFLVLAHRKLKEGGSIALVMPVSLMSGDAWEDSRKLLAKNYSDLIVVSISGTDGSELSFSADTDIGECLVVGRKSKDRIGRACFVVLNKTPEFPAVGAGIAAEFRRIAANKKIRTLEEGPVGGTALRFGDDEIGQVIDAPLGGDSAWHLARVRDLSLAQSAFQLTTHGLLWLPGMKKADAVPMPMARVASVGHVGPYHADISGVTQTGEVRGPFEIVPAKAGSAATYPVLWSHNAKEQQSLSFPADSEGVPRQGADPDEKIAISEKIATIQASASHCHFNRDFRFNSQSTGMQFTKRRTIGGRAWISIKLASEKQEKTLTLYGNTCIGLLLHWYYANKQQAGRGSMGVSPLRELPVYDVRKLSGTELTAFDALFDKICHERLLPLHEIDQDPVRAKLDEEFARIMGWAVLRGTGGPLDLLRSKLALEPSIRGHKK